MPSRKYKSRSRSRKSHRKSHSRKHSKKSRSRKSRSRKSHRKSHSRKSHKKHKKPTGLPPKNSLLRCDTAPKTYYQPGYYRTHPYRHYVKPFCRTPYGVAPKTTAEVAAVVNQTMQTIAEPAQIPEKIVEQAAVQATQAAAEAPAQVAPEAAKEVAQASLIESGVQPQVAQVVAEGASQGIKYVIKVSGQVVNDTFTDESNLKNGSYVFLSRASKDTCVGEDVVWKTRKNLNKAGCFRHKP